jgi:Flp pilus assembly CpaF family ATPase
VSDDNERDDLKARAHAALLRKVLGQLVRYLEDPQTYNVNVNADGAIVVEHGERGRFTAPETMSARERQSLVTYLASRNDREVHRLAADLECDLPEYDTRVQAFCEPLGDPWTIMLRRHAARIMTLDEYVAEERMTQLQRDAIGEAIRCKRNILVGGAFNSGKTTLINALLAESARLWPNERLAVVQDRRELKPSHKDCIMLFARVEQQRYDAQGNRSRYLYDFPDVLERLARTSASLLAWGEIRDPRSAAGIALALNLGLTGLMATIHANGARKVLDRIERLLRAAGEKPDRSEIADAIGFVVFMALDESGFRRVSDVQHVAGVDAAGEFVLEPAA